MALSTGAVGWSAVCDHFFYHTHFFLWKLLKHDTISLSYINSITVFSFDVIFNCMLHVRRFTGYGGPSNRQTPGTVKPVLNGHSKIDKQGY